MNRPIRIRARSSAAPGGRSRRRGYSDPDSTQSPLHRQRHSRPIIRPSSRKPLCVRRLGVISASLHSMDFLHLCCSPVERSGCDLTFLPAVPLPAGSEFVDGAPDGYLIDDRQGKISGRYWRGFDWRHEHSHEGHLTNRCCPMFCTTHLSLRTIFLVASARWGDSGCSHRTQCCCHFDWYCNGRASNRAEPFKRVLQQKGVPKGKTAVGAMLVVPPVRVFVHSSSNYCCCSA